MRVISDKLSSASTDRSLDEVDGDLFWDVFWTVPQSVADVLDRGIELAIWDNVEDKIADSDTPLPSRNF